MTYNVFGGTLSLTQAINHFAFLTFRLYDYIGLNMKKTNLIHNRMTLNDSNPNHKSIYM